METIRCDACGSEFFPGNDKDGLPNGVGFLLPNGTQINVCNKCIMDAGAGAFCDGFWEQYSKEKRE